MAIDNVSRAEFLLPPTKQTQVVVLARTKEEEEEFFFRRRRRHLNSRLNINYATTRFISFFARARARVCAIYHTLRLTNNNSITR